MSPLPALRAPIRSPGSGVGQLLAIACRGCLPDRLFLMRPTRSLRCSDQATRAGTILPKHEPDCYLPVTPIGAATISCADMLQTALSFASRSIDLIGRST